MAQISNINLHIKKRPFVQWLALFIFVMPFLIAFLMDILRAPNLIKYTIDLAWVLCIALLFMKRHIVFDRKFMPFFIFIGVFFLYTLIGYMFNYQSVFFYLWGFRNNFRFFSAFIIFCMLFTEDDVEFCMKFLDFMFWVNIAVSLFQFFVLGLEQDYLGGIFGIERGCNSYSIIFFSIVLSKSILMFMSKQETALNCFLKCGATLVISAMAELKFFFVIFVIILLLSTIFTSFSWRKFLIILLSAILFTFASSILTELFGESSNVSFERIMELTFSTNYSSQEDLSRFTAIPTLSESVMHSDLERIFGMGLGNCDTSTFAICNTPFYQTYSYLHYSWFSSAFLFLETGFVGLTMYLIFFVMCLVFSLNQRRQKDANKLYCQMAVIMSIICLALTFYNGSLRFEVAYMVYFVLALPFIDSRSKISRLNP
ncbi:MAG: hypothetical protein IJD68_02115 [Ruminococcus sp.]|nr:hypothetical protein [Ruminococcus sp.]